PLPPPVAAQTGRTKPMSLVRLRACVPRPIVPVRLSSARMTDRTRTLDFSARTPRPTLRAWLDREIALLYPGCFALVMATGIISNAFFLEGRHAVSDALFAANLVAYPWLIALTVLRAVRHGRALWKDLLDPRLVFSFFTIVAGTDVFGIALNLRGF